MHRFCTHFRSGSTRQAFFLCFAVLVIAAPGLGQQSRVHHRDSFRVFEPGSYLRGFTYVRFDPQTPSDVQDAIHDVAGSRQVLWKSRLVPGLCRVRIEPGKEFEVVNAYLDHGEVLYAEPEYEAYPTQVPNDPGWVNLWGMVNCRADAAWDMYTGSPSFKVAIIDSGIDYSHADLQTNIWTNPGEIAGNGVDDDGNGYVDDVFGYDFAYDDSDPFDDIPECGGHGTHVSGTVGAVGNNGTGVVGVDWSCSLVACKVGLRTWTPDPNDPNGGTWACNIANMTEALEYATLVNCRVSNNSYESTSFQQAMYDMIEAAQSSNHVFVAAAGNGGKDGIGDNNDTNPIYPASYDLPNIVAVAAIDPNDSIAGFSNFGAASVDLGAPGVLVFSTLSSVTGSAYGTKNGTSMATPHVAGAAALITARYPALTWEQIKNRITSAARPVASLFGITVTGGVLDALYALGMWADFSYVGTEDGSFSRPYDTLGEALAETPASGFLFIKTGGTPWTGTINQPITIDNYNGSAIIGE